MGVMVVLVAMVVGLMIMLVAVHVFMLVAVFVFVLVMVMMVVLMLMHMLDSCFVAVEPGHIVIMVLEALCKLDVEIAGVDAMLVYARYSDRKAVDRQRGELLSLIHISEPTRRS